MQSSGEIGAAAMTARRSGDFLRCYDLASRGLEQHPNSHPLAQAAVLALADLGNPEAALELYERFSRNGAQTGEDWLALRGRLHKELALRHPATAQAHLADAAQAYEDAFRSTGKSYSGVNAASMRLLHGDRGKAEQLAREVLELLKGERPQDEAAHYFHHATRAEAALVLGDEAGARAALGEARPYLQRDATARGGTLRQLRLLCAALPADPALLDVLPVPDFACLLPQECSAGAAAHLGEARAAAVFVAPCSSSEIMLAQRIRADGAPLHLVLPAPREQAVPMIAAVLGEDWGRRLQELIDGAQDISAISGFIEGEQQRALIYARQVAIGLSRLRARQSGAPWRLLCADAQEGAALMEATAPDTDLAKTWPCPLPGEGAGLSRRHAALIFADMAGFSKLGESELPLYWNRLMAELAKVLARYSPHVLLQNTWGDALYLVVDAAQPAAALALEIIATVARVRATLPGTLATLNLRVSAHYAPVYAGWDPVTLGRIYYGSHVSLAARIEPVTPPGSVYVTEALAAQLMLEHAEGFDLHYAGEVELAKRFGRRRMFSLRTANAMPPVERASDAAPRKAGLVIGCTGTLLLSAAQKEWVRQQLMHTVLPDLCGGGAAQVTLVMGVAPGADLLFAETAAEWLATQNRPYRICSVLPVPPEPLLADWNEKIAASGAPDIEAETRLNWVGMRSVLNHSASVTHLWPPEADVVDFATKSYRQRQYRRLGAYLVSHCDVLVAIYSRNAVSGVGGTGEVVEWWREPSRIPAGIVEGIAQTGKRPLAILDPVRRETILPSD